MAPAGLRDDEHLLVGSWLPGPRGAIADETCERIESLVKHVLVHVTDHPNSGAWESLFRDPRDGRLWERYYPEGHMHGGGPPALRHLTQPEVDAKYFAKTSR